MLPSSHCCSAPLVLEDTKTEVSPSITSRLVEKGWNVAIADIKPNEKFAEKLGDACTFYKCDIADYDSQAEMFQQVWDKHGRVDALCANAGIVDRR